MLGVTKQMITKLIKQGDLIPVKESTQGSLFLRSDIEALKAAKILGYRYPKFNAPFLYEPSGITRDNVKFFWDNISQLDELLSISIYKYKIDAVFDNHFIPSSLEKYGELEHVINPYFVARDINGREIWLSGCNAGYGGEGPHGSYTILKELGFDDQIANLVFSNSVVNLFRYLESKNWGTRASEGSFKEWDINSGDATVYLFRGSNLVLVQEPHWLGDHSKLLQKYQSFIPNPYEIVVFPTRQLAIEQNYIALSMQGYEEVYRFIIHDRSGRQLWLRPVVEDKPISDQPQLVELLKLCGFEIPKKNIENWISSWLNINIRVTPPKPTYLVKNRS